MKSDPKEKEIITLLSNGRKTWTGLLQKSKMSKETLFLKLMKLMEKGRIIKYGAVEFGKIIDYYDLAKKKESAIVTKVPAIFEKRDFHGWPVIKKDLDLEQTLTLELRRDFVQLMHFARKVLAVKYAEELSPKKRIEYIENWKREAVSYASEWMDSFIEGIVQYSDASWKDIFGSYEDDPTPFFKAVTIFSEKLDLAEQKRNAKLKQKNKKKKIEL